MPRIERTALVPYPARDMFDLVNDIAMYPQFLSWCSNARVVESSESQILGNIEINLVGIKQTFSTRNTLSNPQFIDIEMVDGPFEYLAGKWGFKQLGDLGCRINLGLDFEFRSSLLNSAFAAGFSRVAGRLVDDFCKRADVVFGEKALS